MKMFYSNLIYHNNLIASEMSYGYNTMHATLQARKHIQKVIRNMVCIF